MTYRDLVVDGKVQRRAYAAQPNGYHLGEPVPGWDRWSPVELTERRGRPMVIVTALEALTEHEHALVEVWKVLDELAATRDYDQTGPAWAYVRRVQRWRLRVDLGPVPTIDEYNDAVQGLARDEERLVRSYVVALADTQEALRIARSDPDPVTPLMQMLDASRERAARKWGDS